jgi:hypothetical protein
MAPGICPESNDEDVVKTWKPDRLFFSFFEVIPSDFLIPAFVSSIVPYPLF